MESHDDAVSKPTRNARLHSRRRGPSARVPRPQRPADRNEVQRLDRTCDRGVRVTDRRAEQRWAQPRHTLENLDSQLDVGANPGRRAQREQPIMRVRVNPDRMTARQDFSDHVGMLFHFATDDEERRGHASRVEHVEHAPGPHRIRTIVEGQHNPASPARTLDNRIDEDAPPKHKYA